MAATRSIRLRLALQKKNKPEQEAQEERNVLLESKDLRHT